MRSSNLPTILYKIGILGRPITSNRFFFLNFLIEMWINSHIGIDVFNAKEEGSAAYFCSHAHTDHTIGMLYISGLILTLIDFTLPRRYLISS